jgi:hypothetical protein
MSLEVLSPSCIVQKLFNDISFSGLPPGVIIGLQERTALPHCQTTTF